MNSAPDDEAERLLDAVGQAFASLRRRTSHVPVEPPVTKKDLNRNLIINIVDEADGEVTVGDVAERLDVDPSVASRFVSDAINADILSREASQRDGRRVVLVLTKHGLALRDQYRRQHRQAFEFITRDWPAHERLELARLIAKYARSTNEAIAKDPE